MGFLQLCCCVKRSNAKFDGQGRRLGSSDERGYGSNESPKSTPTQTQNDTPHPIIDTNIDDNERQQIRDERIAAAEARAKKQGMGTKKKKKYSDNPLVGKGTEPLMRWTAS